MGLVLLVRVRAAAVPGDRTAGYVVAGVRMVPDVPTPVRCSLNCTEPLVWQQLTGRWLHLVDRSVCDPGPDGRDDPPGESPDWRTAITE